MGQRNRTPRRICDLECCGVSIFRHHCLVEKRITVQSASVYKGRSPNSPRKRSPPSAFGGGGFSTSIEDA